MSTRTSTGIIRRAEGTMLRAMPLMMTCRQFEEFILDYREGTLPKRQKFVFELHLRMCRECRDYLAAYRRTIEVTKRLFDADQPALPEEIPGDLIKAVLAARDA